MKRFNLALADLLFTEVERIADEREETVTDVLRAFVRLGVSVRRFQDRGGRLIYPEQGKEQDILLL